MQPVNKQKLVSGAFWKLMEILGSKGISFVVTMVLARLLTPEDYGLVAIAMVFIALSEILVQSGLTTALIRKESVDEADYSAVFYASMAVALVLYVAILLFADLIADFYKEEALSSVLRVLCLTFFFQAFSSIRIAKVTREFLFKTLARCSCVASAASGIVGIVLAIWGMGVWALVIQQLSQQLLLNTLLVVSIRWQPCRTSIKKITDLLPFGMSVLTSSLINFIGDSGFDLAVGKVYSVQSLGYYSKGGQLPRQFSLYTVNALTSVLLPAFSSRQDDPIRLKGAVLKSLSVIAYFIFPFMAVCSILSEEILLLMFGDQWLPAAPIFQSFCIYYTATPIMLICIQVFFALGKGSLRIRTEVVRLILTVIVLCLCVFWLPYNINALAFGKAIVEVCAACMCLAIVVRLLSCSLRELVSAFAFPLSGTLGLVVLCDVVTTMGASDMVTALLELVLAASLYFVLSFIFKPMPYLEMKSLISRVLKGRKA